MITKSEAINTATASADAIKTSTAEGLKAGTASAAAGIEQAKSHINDSMHRALKTAEKMTTFGQGNVEAFMKSSQILTTGLTDMTKLMAEHARANLDETMSVLKAMSSAKSVKEAIELQSSFARTSVEKVMAGGGKLTEHSLKLAEHAMAPISARMNVAVETFS